MHAVQRNRGCQATIDTAYVVKLTAAISLTNGMVALHVHHFNILIMHMHIYSFNFS